MITIYDVMVAMGTSEFGLRYTTAPDVLHTSKLPLRDEAFKPLKYKMAG